MKMPLKKSWQSVSARVFLRSLLVFGMSLFSWQTALAAQPDFDFFEQHIRPVLVAECVECHGAEKQKAGLRLDSRAGWQKGGESGAALKPGRPEESLLLQTIRHEIPDLKMPDKAPKLDDAVIERFRQWIAMGAPDPRDNPPVAGAQKGAWSELFAARKSWWSLQPIKDAPPPISPDSPTLVHPVDLFLNAAMLKAGLSPNPIAAPEVLVRRLHFVLTGLPPDPAEVESFVRACGSGPEQRARAVQDRARHLTGSFAFGEHWARHWMDLVRYADSHGSEGDPEIPNAHEYRDYLIRALNADVPIDRLILEHLAGDLISDPRISAEGINESRIGPAHLRMVDHGFQPVDTLDDKIKAVDNQIDVVTKSFLALTVSCARCHDHKFDAVSQRDYTAMYGIFGGVRPAQVCADSPQRLGLHRRGELLAIKERIRQEFADLWLAELRGLPGLVALKVHPARNEDAARLREQLARVEAEIASLQWKSLGAGERSNIPAPIGLWTFSAGPQDLMGGLKSELLGDAVVRGGALVLDGQKSFLRTAPLPRRLSEKTLEAWLYTDNLSQRGGGVLGVEGITVHAFDTVVFGESAAKKWLPGSNNFKRTQQPDGMEEISKPDQRVHIAITYAMDGTIAVYRNGEPYGIPYKKTDIQVFNEGDSRVLIGLRHTGAGNGFFQGRVDEARIYDRELSAQEVYASFRAGSLSDGAIQNPDPSAVASNRVAMLRSEAKELSARISVLEPQLARPRFAEVVGKETHPLFLLWKAASLEPGKFPDFAAAYRQKIAAVIAANKASNAAGFKLAWDLGTRSSGWFLDGPDVQFVECGDFRVAREGGRAFTAILPAGVGSSFVFGALGGIAASPEFRLLTKSVSVRFASSNGGMLRIIPDNYPLGSNGSIFQRAVVNRRTSEWQRFDTSYRVGCSAYVELSTLDHQTRRADPPKGGGAFEKNASEFFVEKVVFHDSDSAPKEEFHGTAQILEKARATHGAGCMADYANILTEAVTAWRSHTLSEAQRELIDACVEADLFSSGEWASPEIGKLVGEYRKLEVPLARPVFTPGVLEHATVDAPLLERGDHTKPGALVPRAFLSALGGGPVDGRQSGRLEFARALLSQENPLTPRVMANRIWHWTFGAGIVPTVDNFGRMGEKPSHPELLDFMAKHLAGKRWSLKETLLFLVTSEAFQRSSVATPAASQKDPSNLLLSHANVRRLEAESIRDSLLKLAGVLDQTRSGPAQPSNATCRSVYLKLKRNSMPALLATFDAPKPFTTMGRRDVTTVPAQSLTMLNDPAIYKLASGFAARLQSQKPVPEECASLMFHSALGRPPTAQELQFAMESYGSSKDFPGLAHAIMNLKEFIYLP
jgi:cytochrome c553